MNPYASKNPLAANPYDPANLDVFQHAMNLDASARIGSLPGILGATAALTPAQVQGIQDALQGMIKPAADPQIEQDGIIVSAMLDAGMTTPEELIVRAAEARYPHVRWSVARSAFNDTGKLVGEYAGASHGYAFAPDTLGTGWADAGQAMAAGVAKALAKHHVDQIMGVDRAKGAGARKWSDPGVWTAAAQAAMAPWQPPNGWLNR